ncbi:hypothetical protein ACUOA8_33695 [Escherichia sp. SS-MK2]
MNYLQNGQLLVFILSGFGIITFFGWELTKQTILLAQTALTPFKSPIFDPGAGNSDQICLNACSGSVGL